MTGQQSIEEVLFRCWHGGNSIAETRLKLARIDGCGLSFEQVRQQFSELSYRFASPVEEAV